MIKRVLVVAAVFTMSAMNSVGAQNRPTQYALSADAVKFTPLDPKNPGGANVSVVSGNLQGPGPITLFLRLPKGPAPLHTHIGILRRCRARTGQALASRGRGSGSSARPGQPLVPTGEGRTWRRMPSERMSPAHPDGRALRLRAGDSIMAWRRALEATGPPAPPGVSF